MSEFAFFRFMSGNMLTVEEQQHKDDMVSLTEQVLDAKGIECDSKVSKISEEQFPSLEIDCLIPEKIMRKPIEVSKLIKRIELELLT